MNPENLIVSIKASFSDASLGEEHTLLEQDFFDTTNRYLSDVSAQYLKATHSSVEDVVSLYWPESSRKTALEAIKHGVKAVNPYKCWQEIPVDYFDVHEAVGYLSPKAFNFYLPAAMTMFVIRNETNEDIDFFDSFLYALLFRHEKYIAYFSHDALQSVLFFLNYYENTKYMSKFDSEPLKKTKILLQEALARVGWIKIHL